MRGNTPSAAVTLQPCVQSPGVAATSGAVSRVLVIGLDGATFDMLTPLAESGRMPNLARLMGTACLSVVESTRPFITPVAWTTFQTGCDPASHGIFDFRYLDHRRRRLLLNHTGRIASPTLYQTVSHSGGEVVSLNLPMTYPAPLGVRGIVVGGLDSPSIEAALSPCPAFAARLKATGARYDVASIWRRKPTGFDELSRGIALTEESFRGQVVAACVADRMTDWRLLVVQFQELDSLEHRCWHLFGIGRDGDAPQAWIDKTGQALRTLDRCVGELLELASRREAAVVVVSDHGFGPFREAISVPELLARRNLLRLPRWYGSLGFHARRGGWRLRKFVWRQMRPGSSTARLTRPLDGLLPIDWRRSVALALHGSLGGLVYLNSKERFGSGPVSTPRLRDQALADTAAAFREAQHPETGEPLFVEVFCTAERLGTNPVERMEPDLVAIPAAGFHTRNKFDPSPKLMRPDPAMVATHRLEGVLMVDAPGVVSGQTMRAHLRDVAPTVLHLLGIPAPASMTGRALVRMLQGASPSGGSASFEPQAQSQTSGIADADQALVESRLRDLGYID